MKIKKIVASLALALWAHTAFPWVQLNRNDALPLISPLYPYDFLNTEIKADYAGDVTKDISERFQISVNMFMETTNYANNQDGIQVPAGDVVGRIGLLAMSYGAKPIGQQESALLANMTNIDYTCFPTDNPAYNSDTVVDENQQFGFLSNPAQYRKTGVRVFASGRIFENIVISAFFGASDMRQSITGLEDQTPYAVASGIGAPSDHETEFTADKQKLQQNLTDQWQDVLNQLGINYSDWHEVGIEDPTLSLTYRVNIPVQQNSTDNKWTKFVFIPHVTVNLTGGFGDQSNPDIMLSLPFGNNGHFGGTLEAGLALAFNDTIEVFGVAAITQYSTLTKTMRVPTNLYQSGLYPYKTSVKVTPSNSYEGSFGLNAHYFVDRLSGYVQVAYAGHEQDTIELVQNDPAYDVARLEQDTEWKYGAVNVGLNYDLSPNVSLGGACQLPMGRKGTYLTNTFMFGMTGTF